MTTVVSPVMLRTLRDNYVRLRDLEIEKKMRAEARIGEINQAIGECERALNRIEAAEQPETRGDHAGA